MSDQQSSPPPKPKPGSLRDRIAAFEKSADTGQAPPPPRPKPSAWKPKVPSPPSSPSSKAIDNAASSSSKVTGTMSASDAKESIAKGGGGSLKDRMAALQGKGAFGAPAPPVAPKPAVEKPRWKPPPVVAAPVDHDGHDGPGTSDEPPTAAIAAAVERTTSPPKFRESLDLSRPIAEGEGTSTTEPPASTEEGTADPEEEEQQRRAAIAARMARLGGARLGMAPPVLAKKPQIPIRKPTREDVSKQEDGEVPRRESISLEERGKPIGTDEVAIVASPPSFTDGPQVRSQSDIEPSSEYLPVRKNSENASLLSVDSTDSNAARDPSSMPVPTVPRRVGPPRKKPMKPSAPPPEVPEVPEERVEEALATPALVSTVNEHEQAIVETTKEEIMGTLEHEEHKEIHDYPAKMHDEPQSIDSHESVEELFAEPTGSGESKEQEFAHDVQSHPLKASDESKQEDEHEDEDVNSDYSDQPEDVVTVHEDHENHHETIDHSDEYDDEHAADHHEHHRLQQYDEHHVNVDAEPQPTSVVSNADAEQEHEDEDAAEEEARRKRVAERLAKMGGVNPFAAPSLPPLRRSSEETGHASSSVVSSHASSPTASSFPRPNIPSRQASLRSSHGVAEPHTLPVVESKVEEQQEMEYSNEFEDEDNDEESFDELCAHEKPIAEEESSSSAYEFSPPPPHQQDAAPVRQLSDPKSRPPIPSSARPYVQMQQHEPHDEAEEHSDRPATRYLSPPPRPSGPPVSHEEPPLPPARPAQPPRRIVPQAPEEEQEQEKEEETEEEDIEMDNEGHENLVQAHLFVRPLVQARDPVSQRPMGGGQRYEVDEDDGDSDGSENDTPALPVLQRRSSEVPPGRSLPPLHHHHLPASPSDISDSDYDGQALPVRPRHIAVLPALAPAQVPPAAPRRFVPSVPAHEGSFSSSYSMPSVAVSEPEPEEILDEEEGDPIDPAFHSPSRRGSMANMRASGTGDTSGLPPSPNVPALPVNVEIREEQQQQDQDQGKRQTIAERMARLGGIKFGAAPIPTAISRPPPRVPREERELDEEDDSHHHPECHPQADAEDVEQPVEVSEEEARKERMTAKLAGIGGMRIGMVPMGMGSLPPQRALVRDESVPLPSPTRAVPPPPARPQTQDTDSERASDDGVKVEAEESEIEEVDYEDAVQELEETTPPLPPPVVPSREGRVAYRIESSDKGMFSPAPPPPGSRPPVPAALPTRRSSVQTSKPVDAGFSPSQTAPSHLYTQSEYVIVDEPHSIEEASPPSRRAPVRPPPNPTVIPQTSDNSISSQWELPSIPTASLDFGKSTDLSLSSWTDAGEPTSPPVPLPLPGKQPAALQPTPKTELQLSTDDLMMMWGRVGVQVCEVATSLFEKSKKALIGDGTYAGFITAVLAGVPNAAPIAIDSGEYGYLIYAQNGSSVQKRVSEIMPGDIVEIHDGKLKGHKGIHVYHQNVGGSGEVLLGIVGEFEVKKSKIRVFHANQHVGQQTVESVSYRLEDLKSGTVKVYRVLEE